MSLLSFLRIVEAVQSRSAREAPQRNRRLELETLERRAVLTLLVESEPLVLSLEEPTAALEQPLSMATETSTGSESSAVDSGGSASGTGEPDAAEPTSEPVVPHLAEGGSGGGGGSDQSNILPELTLSADWNSGNYVFFTGTVTDLDGVVEGLTVYFSVGGDTSISFTATVQAGGSFATAEMEIGIGTIVTAYTIDVDGNRSDLVSAFV